MIGDSTGLVDELGLVDGTSDKLLFALWLPFGCDIAVMTYFWFVGNSFVWSLVDLLLRKLFALLIALKCNSDIGFPFDVDGSGG